NSRRRGVNVVECAFVLPIVFLLILGLLIGGMGVYRYQQVATMAREGARRASVRGSQYAQEMQSKGSTTAQAATHDDLYQQADLPRAISFDTSKLSCTVSWQTDKWPEHVTTSNGQARMNTVTVTVTYQWVPEAYLGGITLSSTSVLPMSY